MNKKYNSNKQSTVINTNMKLTLNVPIKDADIRSTYLSERKIILKHLPIPTVKCVHNHSYATIRSCFNDYLMSGKLPPKMNIKFDKNNIVSRIEESDMAISIANNVRMGMKQDNGDYLIILGILWSDDFAPNSSLKANRGSAWIKT